MKQIGEITQYIDVAQIVLYAFWIFFLLLVLYLNRESRREGYPLRTSRRGKTVVKQHPTAPKPKIYRLFHGDSVKLPSGKSDDHRELAARDGRTWDDPIEPTGNCMLDGLGAAAWVERSDTPDKLLDGSPRIVPMSELSDEYHIPSGSPDPRGMRVMACDGKKVGVITDIWLDRMESLSRYYTVTLDSGNTVLLPVMLSRIVKSKQSPSSGTLVERLTVREKIVQVASIYSHQFDDVPALASASQITLLEEDKVSAYYGGGHLHASADRAEPIL